MITPPPRAMTAALMRLIADAATFFDTTPTSAAIISLDADTPLLLKLTYIE